jgi:hypothetical protein
MNRDTQAIGVLNAMSHIILSGPMLSEYKGLISSVINESSKAFPDLLSGISEKYNIACSGGLYYINNTADFMDNKADSESVLISELGIKSDEINDLRDMYNDIYMNFEELSQRYDAVIIENNALKGHKFYEHLSGELETYKVLIESKDKIIESKDKIIESNNEMISMLKEKIGKLENPNFDVDVEKPKNKKSKKGKKNNKDNKDEKDEKDDKKKVETHSAEIKEAIPQEVIVAVPVLKDSSYKEAVLAQPEINNPKINEFEINEFEDYEMEREDVPFNLSSVRDYHKLSKENLFRADVNSAKRVDEQVSFIFKSYHVWDYPDLEIYGDVKICYQNSSPFLRFGEYAVGENSVLYEIAEFDDGISRYIPTIRGKKLMKCQIKKE